MNGYNAQLVKLRKAKGLTIKEASENIGISSFKLYLFENGYFRPGKKSLKKIEDYYQESISIEGIDTYPTPVHNIYNKKKNKKTLLIKRIVFATLSLVMMSAAITGAILFNESIHNDDAYFGDVYNRTRASVEKTGTVGHDLVTSLEFYTKDYSSINERATIEFYKTDNLLYFNECSYSNTYYEDDLGIGRYHFVFGGNLGIESNCCTFSYAGFNTGSFLTCEFLYDGNEVAKLDSFKINVQGHYQLSEELALRMVNDKIGDANNMLSKLISNELGEEVDFVHNFIPAREQGRIIVFTLQTAGLILIIPSIFLFFIFFGIFIRLMIVNIKPRLLLSTNQEAKEVKDSLPKDLNIPVGVPDTFIAIFARVVSIASVMLMIVGLLATIGIIPLPSVFGDSNFTSFLQMSLLAGVFLAQFISLVRIKRPEALFKVIIYDLFLFLFIATMETAIIGITNAWGYDFASLIYSYVPGNVFEILAVHYIIFLFLFFEPSFLNKAKKYWRYIWHSASFIPLAFLIFTYFISNSYALTYGVKENIYINFWFPNGYLPLSIVSILFMYTIFGLRQFFERKYGQKHAQIFFYGDRYNLIENSICAFYILMVGLIDLLFIHNQVGYYLGLGYNQWIFTIIPFILICKYSPNKQQTILLQNEIEELSRDLRGNS